MLYGTYKSLVRDLFHADCDNLSGVDATSFRVQHEDHLDELDDLEQSMYVERRDDCYWTRLIVLDELSAEVERAREILGHCDCVFRVLRKAYMHSPKDKVMLEQLVERTGLPATCIRVALRYLRDSPVHFSGPSDLLRSEDTWVIPGESYLRHKTFADVLCRIREWEKGTAFAKHLRGDVDLTGDWLGKIEGTNNADVFVEMRQSGNQLAGIARINDPMHGIAIYEYVGAIDGRILHMELDPTEECLRQSKCRSVIVNGKPITVESTTAGLGHVEVDGELVKKHRIEGKWVSSVGTAGKVWIVRTSSPIADAPEYENNEMEDIAFIMMGIGSDIPSLEDALNAIKRATESHGIPALRVDGIEHSGRITDLILGKIRSSRFLICDITNERPNVYYELGYAHGSKREVILVAREGTELHFDIKDYNVIFYKNCTELEHRVAKRVGDTLRRHEASSERDG